MNYLTQALHGKPNPIPTATREEINHYSERLLSGTNICRLPACSGCDMDGASLKRHQIRPRFFYIIENQLVEKVIGYVIRWRCPVCKRTRQEYPEFAVPYKRYTVPTLLHFSSIYTKILSLSYRRMIDALPLIHHHPDEPMMEHSTAHRWITTLGGYINLLRDSIDTIFKARPSLNLPRFLASLRIAPQKYQSLFRHQCLINVVQLSALIPIFQDVLKASPFTQLATTVGFR